MVCTLLQKLRHVLSIDAPHTPPPEGDARGQFMSALALLSTAWCMRHWIVLPVVSP